MFKTGITSAGACVAAALLVSSNVLASDIARDIHQGTIDSDSFVELGIAFSNSREPLIGFNDQEPEESGDTMRSLHIGIHGRYEFRGFFIEAIENSFSNITLGYNARKTESGSLDLIATSMLPFVKRKDLEGFETITDRHGDINLGVRGNYFLGENLLQVELVADTAGAHNGVIAAAQLGRQFQVKNWNLHALGGIRYFSDDVIDHYFGVSPAESTDAIPVYKGKKGFLPTIQVGATYPLNEKWVFRAGAEYSRLPDAVTDSSFATDDHLYILGAGFYRVLYSG